MALSRDKQHAGFLIRALAQSGAKREGESHHPVLHPPHHPPIPCAVENGEMASSGEVQSPAPHTDAGRRS